MKKQRVNINTNRKTNFFVSVILILIFLMKGTIGYAQSNYDPPPIKWGDVKISDFQIKAPDFQPDATSLTICRYGQAYVSEAAGRMETRIDVHVRFIVLHTDGIDRADVSINFWTGSNSDKIIANAVKKTAAKSYRGGRDGYMIDNIEGCVYNLSADGKVISTKLKSDQIFVNDYSDIANFGTVKFALPKVKVGSVAEYKYTIIKRDIFTVERWYFQKDDPCLHSEYRVSFPDNKAYAVIRKGLMRDKIKFSPSTLTSMNLGRVNDEVYSYELDSIPGLPDEAYVMSMNNFRTQVMIQISEYYDPSTNSNVKIISTWKQLANDYKYSDRFGRLLNQSSNWYSQFDYVYAGSGSEIDKVEKIFNFTRDHFLCNNKGYTMADKNMKDVYNASEGSSVEINIFLAALLKKAGFKPVMALVSTRKHGIVNEKYPFISQFNHVICMLDMDGKTLFLDASYGEGDYRFPPAKIVGCKAFVVDPKNPEFIEITTDAIYNKFVMCAGTVVGDSLKGKLQFRFKGYAAARQRAKLDKYGDEYMHDVVNENDILVLSNPMIVNADNYNKPFLTQVDYSMELINEKANNLLFINPFSVYGDFNNELKSGTRDFPVEFNYPYKITYMFTITIPDGYVIEDVPDNVNTAMHDNYASVLVFYQVAGNVVQIKTELKINSLIIPQSEYQNLKALFNLWQLKHDEMIVLKKSTD